MSAPTRRRAAWSRALLALAAGACLASPLQAATRALVVSGLGGDPDFDHRFAEWNTRLTETLRKITSPDNVVSLSGQQATAVAIEKAVKDLAQRTRRDDMVLVVLIGHGSHGGDEYRFNIPGPDLTGSQFKALLDRLPAERQLVVNTTSASGAVAESWKRPGRVVITATRSGGERNATRFAQYFVEALATDKADRDKDQLITAAEAFAYASQAVAESFKADAAMATEHARMEGADPQRLVVARYGRAAQFADDPQLLALQQRQSALELELNSVKARKSSMPEDDYYAALEPVLLRMAQLGQEMEARETQLGLPPSDGAATAPGSSQ